MTDVLYTFPEIRAAIPDNTSNLISPENVRSALLSVAADVGEVGDDTAFVLALAAGVPTNLNVNLPNPSFSTLRGWTVDGNAALVSDLDAEFQIAPGHVRGVQISAVIVCQNDGIADDVYTFDLLKGVVVVGTVDAILEGGANAEDLSIAVIALDSYEPALEEPWSIQVTSVGGEDLAIDDFDMRVWGMPI